MKTDVLISHFATFLQLLIAVLGKGRQTYNIATHKPAKQSSTYLTRGLRFDGRAGFAVDGIANSKLQGRSCAHTAISRNYRKAWWEVDLQQQFTIGNIRILNREGDRGCGTRCGERLHDVRVDIFQDDHQLRLGKHCNTHTGVAGPGWLNMTCASPVTGRYVRITKPQTGLQDVLTLCEVEIYEAPEGQTYNIAIHKPAKQSSTFHTRALLIEAWAGLAVDGIANSQFRGESCTHTADNSTYRKPWWEVDLQQQFRIGNIRILNREADRRCGTRCGERLHDVRVDVFQDDHQLRFGKHCNTHTGVAGPGWLNMTCASPVTGRYVRITKPRIEPEDVLTLCEVEIYEAQDLFRSEYFGRMVMTQAPTRGERMMTSSNLHCGTICVRSAGCLGFTVKRKEVGNLQCQILFERPNKGGEWMGGDATSYFALVN